MKTVSQLGSGKQPVGTTAYMGRVADLMQCCCAVQRGIAPFSEHGFKLLLPFGIFMSGEVEAIQSQFDHLYVIVSDCHIGASSSFGLYHMNCCLECNFIRWLNKLLYQKSINFLSL